MAVATLYDIHGNLAALEAVLAEVPDDATIVVGGDVFAGGTIRPGRSSGSAASATASSGCAATPTASSTPTSRASRRRRCSTRRALRSPTSSRASSGRTRRRCSIGRTLYCHATPRNDLDIFTEHTPEEQIAFLFADVDADVVVGGHTHVQFDREIAGKRVVNSGSVGSPYEDEPGAYWTLDLEPRRTRTTGSSRTGVRARTWLDWCEPRAVTS